MQTFRFPVTNGSYEFQVGNSPEVNHPYHQLMLSFSAVPSAGFLKVEAQLAGDTDWIRISEAGSIPLVEDARVQFVAPASKYRFTLSGVTGGGGTITVRIFDLNTWFGAMPPEGLYEGLRAETVQTYIETNVKNGLQYESGAETTGLAANGNLDIVFITTSKPALIKARQLVFTGAKITARVYKAPVYTGGTPVPIYNLSDINPVPKTTTILSGVTISNVGTEFAAPTFAYGTTTGVGNSVGTYAVTGLERNLAKNTTYLLRITNGDTQPCNVASYITWFEGTPDLPRSV